MIAVGVGWVWVNAAGLPVHAQSPDVPLVDVLEIIEADRKLIAIDAKSGGETVIPLEVDEEVEWSASRGRVGVVLTSRRLLAVASVSSAWQEARFQRGEARPERAELGDRVALALTSRRAIGFDGGSGNLIEEDLGPREQVVASGVGENTVVVVTERRALGLSPFAGGFFARKLGVRERVVEVSALANLVVVRTDRRILSFRAPTGTWAERKLQAR